MTDKPYSPQDAQVIVETPDVRVSEITLAPRAATPSHEHTEVEELCYCLEGEVTCEVEGGESVVLMPGRKMHFPARQDHRLMNHGDVPCRFLLVHGVGRFNFVKTPRS